VTKNIPSTPNQSDLEVIFQDQSLVAINKPSGLLVHRSAIDFHEQYNAQEQLQARLATTVYPVHRLDKPTSGVLLFALNKETAAKVSLQFQQYEVTKHYIAVVRGHTDAGARQRCTTQAKKRSVHCL